MSSTYFRKVIVDGLFGEERSPETNAGGAIFPKEIVRALDPVPAFHV
jgi:hypothetical protein